MFSRRAAGGGRRPGCRGRVSQHPAVQSRRPGRWTGSASLDAGTGYGRIHNALKNTEGTAELNIHATTLSQRGNLST
jgi:hypothetical protein